MPNNVEFPCPCIIIPVECIAFDLESLLIIWINISFSITSLACHINLACAKQHRYLSVCTERNILSFTTYSKDGSCKAAFAFHDEQCGRLCQMISAAWMRALPSATREVLYTEARARYRLHIIFTVQCTMDQHRAKSIVSWFPDETWG